ncbi:activator-dependent family glycosyltransferase [Nocardiopsis ganjiahuensis]|uniref:activator-dependent family glycosyltransferase n=1 Tax=Nocardiopsis ganjiahuensis TaxID=239984 RepID=UPI000477209B|nr:activator-dependent family glycosyltransferase [Nocardiopsis ganjiahuensis]
MRVVLASYTEKTHFIGMVALAWALRAAGHEVRVATQPALSGFASEAGLASVPVGRDHRLRSGFDLVAGWGEGDARGFFDVGDSWPGALPWDELRWGMRDTTAWWWKPVNEPMLEDLVSFCRSWRPDLVIWESTTFSAAIAAEACGAAHARFLWSLDLFAAMREQYLQRAAERPEATPDDPMRAWLEDRAARHGVEFSETLIRGQFTLDYLPASLGVPAETGTPRLPLRYVPYNGRAVIPDWLRTPPERPRIGVSVGTSTTDWFGGHTYSLTDLLKGLSELDVEVVATLPDEEAARIRGLADNVRLVGYAPLDILAPTCELMVTHVGPGTLSSGLVHGVPQLLAPGPRLDAPLLARRVEEAGAGLVVTPEEACGERFRETARRILADGGFTEAAGRLRAEMAAMPSPASVVAALPGLLEQGFSRTA